MKRTRLRRVSKKRAVENKEYLTLRVKFLDAQQFCGFSTCYTPACDVHHKHGRSGSNFLNIETWMAVYRKHHDYIHANANHARKLGYLK